MLGDLDDSTRRGAPAPWGTLKRGEGGTLGDTLSDAADVGYCANHSRWFGAFACTP